ncbi:ABZJ_00895 family protein [Psychrobacter sp. M13]|uniref:ABZJ_00895 family protein n=1 Tax=Psychrobacter sp. M13 TaxID=3067275 RepID=UPI00273C696F|nr:ABZJ_00895 family protein [Psychrobacter sp. M13]WLP95004.1 ABZJ_00895 family protein [Psychrobacter sp. M13]
MSHLSLNKLKAKNMPNQQLASTALTLYVGFFALGFIIASALFMMIQSKITLNSQLITGLSIVIAAYVAIYKFVKHQQRALTAKEINRLTVRSTAIIWLLAALYFLCLWLLVFDAVSREVLIDMTRQQPMPLLFALAMIIVFTLLVTRLSLWAINHLLAPKH